MPPVFDLCQCGRAAALERVLPLVLAVLALSLAALPAPGPTPADPCAGDVKQHCPDVEPGGGRVLKCLKENKAKLSSACQEKLEADDRRAREVLEKFAKACGGDTKKLCGSVKPGGGRVLDCLMQNEARLSPPCQAETKKVSDAREAVSSAMKACQADAKDLCEGMPRTGPLVECLQANRARLSPGCKAMNWDVVAVAARFVDTVDTIAEDRIKESLEILQGVDSVAFSRSQFVLQFDNFQDLAGSANADRYLFSPQFVFGQRNQYAIQVKVPILTLYPHTPAVPTKSGIASVNTAFSWAFFSRKGMQQFVALGLQWNTAADRALGAPWVAQPTYVISLGLARFLALTTEFTWLHTVGPRNGFSAVDVLLLRPIFTAILPASSFLALDTKLVWNLAQGGFVPVMKGVAGKFIGKDKSLSISAWYQASLTTSAVSQSFEFGVGFGLSYFFDW